MYTWSQNIVFCIYLHHGSSPMQPYWLHHWSQPLCTSWSQYIPSVFITPPFQIDDFVCSYPCSIYGYPGATWLLILCFGFTPSPSHIHVSACTPVQCPLLSVQLYPWSQPDICVHWYPWYYPYTSVSACKHSLAQYYSFVSACTPDPSIPMSVSGLRAVGATQPSALLLCGVAG